MTGPSAALAGRVAVVTGASRGIGLAVARSLTAAGARVTMLSRGAAELEARARELQAQSIACDVSKPDDVARAAESVRRHHGTPDIIVNNAGFFQLAAIEHTSPSDFIAALEVNLVAPFLLIRAFLPEMRSGGRGHIVSIGSIADHTIFPENGAYSASKYGLRALHDVLRAELRGSGVRCTLVSPGPVDTPLWDPIDPDRRAGFTPRAEMLPATAVADAVCFALTRPEGVDVDLIRLSRS